MSGIGALHAMVDAYVQDAAQVVIATETDRELLGAVAGYGRVSGLRGQR